MKHFNEGGGHVKILAILLFPVAVLAELLKKQ